METVLEPAPLGTSQTIEVRDPDDGTLVEVVPAASLRTLGRDGVPFAVREMTTTKVVC